MNSKPLIALSLALSLSALQLGAFAGHGGGGGGGGHSGGGGGGGGGGGAPRMEAPRAPRAEAPRAQAPRMESPRAEAPRAQEFRAPRMESRASAPRAEMSPAPRMESGAREARGFEGGRSGSTAQRVESARNGGGFARSPERTAENRSTQGSFREQSRNMLGMGVSGVNGARAINNSSQFARMTPQARDASMNRMSAEQRAQTMPRLNNEQRAEAMYKMNPTERAQTLARMSPEARSSFMSPQAARGPGMGRAMAAGAVGLAGAGMASRAFNRPGEARMNGVGEGRFAGGESRANEAGRFNGAENRANEGGRFSGGEGRLGNGGVASRISAPRPFTNPRMAEASGAGRFAGRAASPLRYGAGATNFPRAGGVREGIAGPLDPGGYLRNGGEGRGFVTPGFAREQFGHSFPNYAAMAAANYHNAVLNRGSWGWQLPPYAPSWFNGPSSNSYWWGGGKDWNYGPSWSNGWGGSLPWWMTMAQMLPWGWNSDLSWVPYQNCYSGYTYDGATYPWNYYAQSGYCPTPYVFNVASGQFWAPGQGYTDYLPASYRAPITVSVQESVPQYNFAGQISGYRMETFNYNAYWNEQQQAYGYYDYRQQFHWLTLPWLRSWTGYS